MWRLTRMPSFLVKLYSSTIHELVQVLGAVYNAHYQSFLTIESLSQWWNQLQLTENPNLRNRICEPPSDNSAASIALRFHPRRACCDFYDNRLGDSRRRLEQKSKQTSGCVSDRNHPSSSQHYCYFSFQTSTALYLV